MSAKTPIFLLLGMCLSFSVVLAVVLAVRSPSSPPKRRAIASVQPRLPAAAPAAQASPAAGHLPATHLEPKTPPTLAEPKLVDLTPSVETTTEMDTLKKVLRQRIAELKKDRDQMLNNLAAQLVIMTTDEATTQLNALDDESAALVLVRLKPDKRQTLLKRLEPGRASRLSQALTPASR